MENENCHDIVVQTEFYIKMISTWFDWQFSSSLDPDDEQLLGLGVKANQKSKLR